MDLRMELKIWGFQSNGALWKASWELKAERAELRTERNLLMVLSNSEKNSELSAFTGATPVFLILYCHWKFG